MGCVCVCGGGGGGGEGSHPDPEIRGRPSLKKSFTALQASVWSSLVRCSAAGAVVQRVALLLCNLVSDWADTGFVPIALFNTLTLTNSHDADLDKRRLLCAFGRSRVPSTEKRVDLTYCTMGTNVGSFPMYEISRTMFLKRRFLWQWIHYRVQFKSVSTDPKRELLRKNA